MAVHLGHVVLQSSHTIIDSPAIPPAADNPAARKAERQHRGKAKLVPEHFGSDHDEGLEGLEDVLVETDNGGEKGGRRKGARKA